mgnify:CR=1 FL=1
MEVIELLVFTSASLVPSAKGSELGSSEVTCCLLCGGDGLRLCGLYHHFHFLGGYRGFGEVKVWVANGQDVLNIRKGNLMLMIIIRWSAGLHDVMFSNSASGLG